MNEETENAVNLRGRDPKTGRFIEGNPGKPKGAKNLTTKLREALDKVCEGTGTKYDDELITPYVSLD